MLVISAAVSARTETIVSVEAACCRAESEACGRSRPVSSAIRTDSTASVDYPDFAAKGCKAVQDGSCALVILCCGTGVGMSMCANKMKGIRACCCSDTFSAEFTRRHNNANALCLGGRVVGAGLGCQIVDAFLNAEFEGGRHQMRIDKMMALENH